MVPVIDMTKEYGLVLEGGGAKGAYQIGAWKALVESGVKICAVAGTSVGALNGALICMGDVQKAEELWKNIAYSKVMDVDDKVMKELFGKNLKTQEVVKEFAKIAGNKGVDVTPLRKMIEENIDEELIRNGSVKLYLLTFSVSDMKELDIDIQEEPNGLLADYLLASSYLPVFKNERLHGKIYIDGGMINNVPLNCLVERGYKNIISIRIFGMGREKKVKIADDTALLTISPRVNLGNMLDFDSKKSRRNLKIGYFDAMRLIYGLKGTIYYIEQKEEECYYLNQLVNLEKEVLNSILSIYKVNIPNEGYHIRVLVEVIYPAIALELKLGREWSYETLYLSMLETAAKILKIQKYRIYTVQELKQLVIKRVYNTGNLKNLPFFVHCVLNDKQLVFKE